MVSAEAARALDQLMQELGDRDDGRLANFRQQQLELREQRQAARKAPSPELHRSISSDIPLTTHNDNADKPAQSSSRGVGRLLRIVSLPTRRPTKRADEQDTAPVASNEPQRPVGSGRLATAFQTILSDVSARPWVAKTEEQVDVERQLLDLERKRLQAQVANGQLQRIKKLVEGANEEGANSTDLVVRNKASTKDIGSNAEISAAQKLYLQELKKKTEALAAGKKLENAGPTLAEQQKQAELEHKLARMEVLKLQILRRQEARKELEGMQQKLKESGLPARIVVDNYHLLPGTADIFSNNVGDAYRSRPSTDKVKTLHTPGMPTDLRVDDAFFDSPAVRGDTSDDDDLFGPGNGSGFGGFGNDDTGDFASRNTGNRQSHRSAYGKSTKTQPLVDTELLARPVGAGTLDGSLDNRAKPLWDAPLFPVADARGKSRSQQSRPNQGLPSYGETQLSLARRSDNLSERKRLAAQHAQLDKVEERQRYEQYRLNNAKIDASRQATSAPTASLQERIAAAKRKKEALELEKIQIPQQELQHREKHVLQQERLEKLRTLLLQHPAASIAGLDLNRLAKSTDAQLLDLALQQVEANIAAGRTPVVVPKINELPTQRPQLNRLDPTPIASKARKRDRVLEFLAMPHQDQLQFYTSLEEQERQAFLRKAVALAKADQALTLRERFESELRQKEILLDEEGRSHARHPRQQLIVPTGATSSTTPVPRKTLPVVLTDSIAPVARADLLHLPSVPIDDPVRRNRVGHPNPAANVAALAAEEETAALRREIAEVEAQEAELARKEQMHLHSLDEAEHAAHRSLQAMAAHGESQQFQQQHVSESLPAKSPSDAAYNLTGFGKTIPKMTQTPPFVPLLQASERRSLSRHNDGISPGDAGHSQVYDMLNALPTPIARFKQSLSPSSPKLSYIGEPLRMKGTPRSIPQDLQAVDDVGQMYLKSPRPRDTPASAMPDTLHNDYYDANETEQTPRGLVESTVPDRWAAIESPRDADGNQLEPVSAARSRRTDTPPVNEAGMSTAAKPIALIHSDERATETPMLSVAAETPTAAAAGGEVRNKRDSGASSARHSVADPRLSLHSASRSPSVAPPIQNKSSPSRSVISPLVDPVARFQSSDNISVTSDDKPLFSLVTDVGPDAWETNVPSPTPLPITSELHSRVDNAFPGGVVGDIRSSKLSPKPSVTSARTSPAAITERSPSRQSLAVGTANAKDHIDSTVVPGLVSPLLAVISPAASRVGSGSLRTPKTTLVSNTSLPHAEKAGDTHSVRSVESRRTSPEDYTDLSIQRTDQKNTLAAGINASGTEADLSAATPVRHSPARTPSRKATPAISAINDVGAIRNSPVSATGWRSTDLIQSARQATPNVPLQAESPANQTVHSVEALWGQPSTREFVATRASPAFGLDLPSRDSANGRGPVWDDGTVTPHTANKGSDPVVFSQAAAARTPQSALKRIDDGLGDDRDDWDVEEFPVFMEGEEIEPGMVILPDPAPAPFQEVYPKTGSTVSTKSVINHMATLAHENSWDGIFMCQTAEDSEKIVIQGYFVKLGYEDEMHHEEYNMEDASEERHRHYGAQQASPGKQAFVTDASDAGWV